MDKLQGINSEPLSIFISYAHEDEPLRWQLEAHLSLLWRQGLVTSWHDRQIAPGSEWAKEIDTHLEAAQLVLLLISPDFLASDYCYNVEMQRALERHKRGEARVIPIIVRPVHWSDAPFAQLYCLPRNGKPVTRWENPDEAFQDIIQDIRRVIEPRNSSALTMQPLSSVDRQNRQRLLKRVRTIWIEGVLERSLHQASLIALNLQEQSDALANPWRLDVQETDQQSRPLPTGTSIIGVYDEADGELLILGEPGAGKTTLLLELARSLVERAEQKEQEYLPIVFHLSSWAQRRRPLADWLVEELRTKYQVPRKVGQSWVNTNQLLPLLDGLDEVAEPARIACIQAINIYYQSRLEKGFAPVVVCCRSQEYTALPIRLCLQRAVNIQPLTQDQIDHYLQSAKSQLEGLQRALDHDPGLYTLMQRPLMLNILTLTYSNAKVEDLLREEARQAYQQQLFAMYVERMLARRGASKRFSREQMLQWLKFLALRMRQHHQSVFYLEQIQPNWLVGWLRRLLYRLSVLLLCWLFVTPPVIGGLYFAFSQIRPRGMFTFSRNLAIVLGVGLLDTLIGGLLVALFRSYQGEPFSVGLGAGLLVGPVVGLVGGLVTKWLAEPSTPQLNDRASLAPKHRIWRNLRSGLLGGLVVGLVSGLISGLFVGLGAGLTNSLALNLLFTLPFVALLVGLPVGLIGGLVGGLFFGSGRIQLRKRPTFSWKGVKRSLIIALGAGLLDLLISGLLIALFDQVQGETFETTLRQGLLTGLVVGLVGGLVTTWFAGPSTRQPDDNVPLAPKHHIWPALRKGLIGGSIVGLVSGPIGGLFVILAFALPSEMVSELISGLNRGWLPGLLTGGFVGLVCGGGGGLFFGVGWIQLRGRPLFSWKKAKKRLFVGLGSGLPIALIVGGFFGLVVGLITWLLVGIIIFELGVVLVEGLFANQLDRRAFLAPNQRIWHSLRSGLFTTLVIELLLGLPIGLIIGLGNFNDLLLGLFICLFLVALPLGSFFGLGAFVQHFVLRFWLWCASSLPWNIVAFLDEATERLLMYKGGGGYLFIHHLLLDYFASLEISLSQEASTTSEPLQKPKIEYEG